jgi:hypothetical protein
MVAKTHANYERNKAWYLRREASPEGVRKRVERDQARTKEIKAGKIAKNSPLEVDHIKSLAKGGSGTSTKNLEVISRTANRKKFDH